jgi:hypothetical protein
VNKSAKKIKMQLGSAIENKLNQSQTITQKTVQIPARYQAIVTGSAQSITFGFPCLVILTLFFPFCPVATVSMNVELKLDVYGQIYEATSSGYKWTNFGNFDDLLDDKTGRIIGTTLLRDGANYMFVRLVAKNLNKIIKQMNQQRPKLIQ